MTSNLFEAIGLGNLDIGIVLIIMLIIIIVLIILVSRLSLNYSRLSKKYSKFMRGRDADSLENEIMALFKDNKALKKAVDANRNDIRNIYTKMESTIQKVGIVKYDAYQQMGGMLSFSLALLDENNDGFVINSVHSSEGCYTYIKEILSGTCRLELGTEEQQAVDQAIGE